jgi:hypothetical protein
LIRLLKGLHVSQFVVEKGYVPPSLDGDVTLVLTEDSTGGRSAESSGVDRSKDALIAGWRARVNGELQAYVIDATHQSVVLDPSRAAAVAEVIRSSFQSSDSFSALEGPHSSLLKPIRLRERNA